MEKEYLNHLTKNAIKWKLIRHPTNESWHPSWADNKFLIILAETLATRSIPTKRSKTYYIYCCGLDDYDMSIRDLKWSDAKNIYNKIINQKIISKEQLKQYGLCI